jgi:hypothetical protein
MADVAAVSWSDDLALTVVGDGVGQAATSAIRTAGLRAVVVALDRVADPIPLAGLPAAAVAQAANAPVAIASGPGRSTTLSVGTSRWQLQSARWNAVPAAGAFSYP